MINSNLSSWIGVKRWCDFGANLVQHFMRRYSRCSRYQTVLLKLQEIISTEGRNLQKCSASAGHFCYLLDELRCNELPLRAWIDWCHELHLRCMNCLRHGVKGQFNSWNRRFQIMKPKASIHDGLPVNSLFSAVLFTFCRFYGII